MRVFGGGADSTLGAVSTDNGVTWKNFPTKPPIEKGQGKIAVSCDGKTYVFTTSDEGGAAVTHDRGATWTPSAGLPAKSVRVVSDRVDGQRFYAFDPASGKVFVSTNGGALFAATGAALPPGDGYLRAAPGKIAGDLWLASGKGVYHSINGGVSFIRCATMDEGRRIGFGKPAPNKTVPAVYLSGKKNGVYGFYRSNDGGTNWTRINDDLHQFAGINALSGDPRVYGRVYVASQSRGIVRGDLAPAR